MLRGIPDIIGSDLLKALADTGHGDLIVIADHFYKLPFCERQQRSYETVGAFAVE